MAGAQDALQPQMERDGVAVPENLSKQPRLRSNLVVILEAFYELDTERHHGHGFMRIPWSKIVMYADRHFLDEDELVDYIRAMDDAHIADMKRKQPPSGGPPGSRQTVVRPPRPD